MPIEENIEILLVEDNKSDVILIKHHLKKAVPNANVTVSHNYEHVIDVISHKNPDLVLCDYNLGSFTGLDVFEFISLKSPETPFIFLTGTLDDKAYAERVVAYNAPDYLLKKNINQINQKLTPYLEKITANS